MGKKANETLKNNKPKEQMEWKILLKKAMIDSIKTANVPGIIEPSIQIFGKVGCEITVSFNIGIPIWTNLICTTGVRLDI